MANEDVVLPLAIDDIDADSIKHRMAIRDLVFAYAEFVDRRNYDMLSSVFLEDAVLIGDGFELKGLKAIKDGMRMNEQYRFTQHNVFNHRVSVHGSTARAETYCTAYHFFTSDQPDLRFDMGIRYQDSLVLGDGRWKLETRRLLVDWTHNIHIRNP